MGSPLGGDRQRFKFGSEGGTRARDSRPYGANGDRKRLGDLEVGQLTQRVKQVDIGLLGLQRRQRISEAVVIFGCGTRTGQ
jgi:hypothetical protein